MTTLHQTSRTRADLMSLSDHAANVVIPITDRLQIAHARIVRRLHDCMADVIALKQAGASEAECRMYDDAFAMLNDQLFGGIEKTDDRTAARMELDADCAEDHIEGLLRVEGESPVLLRHHARALRRQSSTSRVRAIVQERKAETITQTRVVARERLNIGGAA